MSSRQARRLLWFAFATISFVSAPKLAVADDELPWLEYRPAVGCPGRDIFKQELLRRLSNHLVEPKALLEVHVEYLDGGYSGRVTLGATPAAAARRVRNDDCDQVIHAMALIAALMLEGESSSTVAATADNGAAATQTNVAESNGAAAAPPPGGSDATTSNPASRMDASSVTTPPQTKQQPTAVRRRPIGAWTMGPWLGLTSDGLATPDLVRFGGRIGALLTLHEFVAGSQQIVRLSLARVQGSAIQAPDGRTAHTTWTSLRLDICHGWMSHTLAVVAICAMLDAGNFSGGARFNNIDYADAAYLARAGGAIYLRQPIWAGLAVQADLGVMVPFSHPSFYFAPSATSAASPIAEARALGPVADLSVEMHFW